MILSLPKLMKKLQMVERILKNQKSVNVVSRNPSKSSKRKNKNFNTNLNNSFKPKQGKNEDEKVTGKNSIR